MVLGIIANLGKRAVWEIVPQFLRWLKERGIQAVVTTEIGEQMPLGDLHPKRVSRKHLGDHCDLVIAFGGDGTILCAARDVSQSGVPILGVNVGRFGFLAEISVEELYEKMDDLLAGRYEIHERLALQATVEGAGKKSHCFALNDVVLDKGGFSRTILIETFIDDKYLNTYNADGLIIATPTGSTAYSLSAGGPLMTPNMKALLITPICPHSLAQRPLIIPEDKTIRIQARSDFKEVLLSADGQAICKLTENEVVRVRKADYPVKLVELSGKTFYEVLRTKLNWGENPFQTRER